MNCNISSICQILFKDIIAICILYKVFIGDCLYSQGDRILLSLKGAYHTADRPDKFEGFYDGFLFDADCEISLNSNLFFAANLIFGNSTNNNFPIPLEESISMHYSFFGVNGILKYRIFKEDIGVVVGGGIGNMDLKITSQLGKPKYSYLNLSVMLGISYFFTKSFFIEAEASYYNLININRTNRMLVLKLGPTLILKR